MSATKGMRRRRLGREVEGTRPRNSDQLASMNAQVRKVFLAVQSNDHGLN